jgi:hypothetical protein
MNHRMYSRAFRWPAIFVLLLGFSTLACLGSGGPYEATFDSLGSWGSGDNADVEGDVTNGTYQMLVKADSGIFWATGGEDDLGSGIYEVEATQLAGALDNGYGMMFRVDNDNDNFFLFEVSGDGYYWIGWCENGCEDTADPIVGDGWEQSAIVNQGLNNLNTLRAEVEGENLVFIVNGQEVGRVTDSRGNETGDIGIMVETLGEAGVQVSFDNFRVTPLETEE